MMISINALEMRAAQSPKARSDVLLTVLALSKRGELAGGRRMTQKRRINSELVKSRKFRSFLPWIS
jgi:hypothetical protein